jgi:hypothetical protein
MSAFRSASSRVELKLLYQRAFSTFSVRLRPALNQGRVIDYREEFLGVNCTNTVTSIVRLMELKARVFFLASAKQVDPEIGCLRFAISGAGSDTELVLAPLAGFCAVRGDQLTRLYRIFLKYFDNS